jgi:hypothetical protein
MPDQTALDTVYLVGDSEKEVTLEIIIGEAGQTATTNINIDAIPKVEDFRGSYPENPLGTNRELQNKTLFIATTITDTSELSNVTEMIIRLRGGAAFREYHLSKVVEEDHQSVPYVCMIQFIKI